MAIIFPDIYGGGQQEVELGRSKIQPRETYGSSAEGIRSNYSDRLKNTDQLVSALGNFEKEIGKANAQEQALIDQQALVTRNVEDVRTDAQTGGAGGGFFRLFTGTGGVSRSTQIKIDQDRGERLFRERLNADPEYQQVLATPSLWEDRNAAMEKLKAINDRIGQEYFKQNPNLSPSFLGGWTNSSLSALQSSDSAALKAQTEIIIRRRDESASIEVGNNLNRRVLQGRSHVIATEMGVDPAKISQFVNIENARWDPNAVSGTGVRGLTQITADRFNDIKDDIARTNPELALRMRDRNDPEASLIALTHDYKKMEIAAKTSLGREPKTAEVYLLWNLGMTGGGAILKAIAEGKLNAKVSDVAVNLQDVNNNKPLYGEGGSRTIGEAMNLINQKMKTDSPYHAQSTPLGAMRSVMFTEQQGIPEGSTRNNYRWADFKNSGAMGGRGTLDSRIVQVLDQGATFLGRKIEVSSAHRSEAHNASQGGADGSQHVHGRGLDIKVTNPEEQKKMARFFASIGVKGIGVYNGHMHIDIGEREAAWSQRGDLPVATLKEAIAQGRQDAASGGVYRPAGFQGVGMSPFQAEVNSINSQYGLGYVRSRSLILDAWKQAAIEAGNKGDIARGMTMMSDVLTQFGPGMTGAERNALYSTQKEVSDTGIKLWQNEQKMKGIAAQNAYDGEYARAEKEEREGRSYMADRSKFNLATAEGAKAFAEAKQLESAGVAFVTPETSAGNAIIAKTRLEEPRFYEELGFGPGEKPRTASEFRSALLKSKRGELNISDITKLTESWEMNRRAVPIAQGEADRAATLQKGTLSNYLSANSAYVQAVQMQFDDPRALAQKMSDHTDLLTAQFKNVFQYWYTKAMQENGGQQPSGAQVAEIMKQSMLTLQGDAQALASRVIAQSKSDVSASQRGNVQDVFDPTATARSMLGQTQLERPLESPIPGARLEVNAQGKPIMEGTSYKYKLPDGTVMYYNPLFEAAKAAPDTVNRSDGSMAGEQGLTNITPRGSQAAARRAEAPIPNINTPDGQAELARQAQARNASMAEVSTLVRKGIGESIGPLKEAFGKVGEIIKQYPDMADSIRNTVNDLVMSNDPVLKELDRELTAAAPPQDSSTMLLGRRRNLDSNNSEIMAINKKINDRKKELLDAFKRAFN